jgi:prepilin-type N-terminal cleavage/methylation domain-containing protein
MRRHDKRLQSQAGYTLIEVVIASAIGVVVMGALTSVILTSVRVSDVAFSRVEATSQLRNFQNVSYDDFARSQVQGASGCTQATPCTTQPIVLVGTQVSNASPPLPSSAQVTYTWDGSNFLDRQLASTGATSHAATDVSSFSWYVDTSAFTPTVVVSLTVTVSSYSQTQTFLFAQKVNP